MSLPVSGATGVIGLPPAPDQTAVPGFAQLVTALLAGSDVISEEVALPGVQLSIPGQEENSSVPAPDEDIRTEIGPEAPWPPLMVHPSLVADALLRRLDQVASFGPVDETPLGATPVEPGSGSHPVAPPAVAHPVAPPSVVQPAAPTEFAIGVAPPAPIPAPATPIDPDVSPVGAGLAPTPPSQPSAAPTDFDPSEPGPGDAAGVEPPTMPPTAVMTPPAGGSPNTTQLVAARPDADLRVDQARPRRAALEGPPAGPGLRDEFLPITTDVPADGVTEIEHDQKPPPTPRSEDRGEATAIPTDRTPRDADPARIGARPAEVLSTAARRVEEAVRQLEAAPPPSVVTMVIEELDLRLTVALRPDGVHLSAPGPDAPQLIRSLEEALHSRGFDLSGRQRGRHGHDQPEAPVLPSSSRPTSRPASGLRL